MNDDDVFEVQRLYPQIYIACHTDHVRAVSTKWRISSQDASILVHLDQLARDDCKEQAADRVLPNFDNVSSAADGALIPNRSMYKIQINACGAQ